MQLGIFCKFTGEINLLHGSLTDTKSTNDKKLKEMFFDSAAFFKDYFKIGIRCQIHDIQVLLGPTAFSKLWTEKHYIPLMKG